MSIKVLLEKRITEFVKHYPEFKDEAINKKFLFFAILYLFKYLNIQYEDIIDGITDGTNDYGIDGIFVFSSGQIVIDDEDLRGQITREDKVRVQLIQVSREAGFGETVLLRVKDGIEEIFNLRTKIKGNEDYRRKVQLIRNIWEHCFNLGSVKNIEVEVIYITLSENESVNRKVKTIERKIHSYLKSQELKNFKLKYLGIPSLYRIITAETYDKEMLFKEITTYAEPYNKQVVGYYGLVKVKDFLEFIINEEEELEERYFEGNVRDYYGITKKVNEKIQKTLTGPDRMNLWCLNNGITIICDNSNPLGKKIKLFNFHIVNGCQTAHVLYDCREDLEDDNTSEIIVKIIQTTNEEVSNDIIDATNSQTAVPPVLLHSNELIQRNIEEHFIRYTKSPLYYERRMNYYKRRHKPTNRIVSIIRLFQVFYSIFGKKPSVARGRPTEAFEKDYSSVFDTSFDYDSYLISYHLYLKIHKINREEATRMATNDPVLFLIRKYGILHIIRIVLPLFINDDRKINFKDRNNIFSKEKERLFPLLENKKLLNRLYRDSVIILRKCIMNFKRKNKELILNYNIMKNEDLDKIITLALSKIVKHS